jgi:hypothetical protein
MRIIKTKIHLISIVELVFLLVCALCVIALPILCQEKEQDKPIETITKAELRDHIYYLASDYLEGRFTGSEGYAQAANYIASQLKAAGLVSFMKDEEGKETYFQRVGFMTCTIANSSTLRMKKGQQETVFTFGQEFLPLLHGQAFKDGRFEGEPVFIGFGLE